MRNYVNELCYNCYRYFTVQKLISIFTLSLPSTVPNHVQITLQIDIKFAVSKYEQALTNQPVVDFTFWGRRWHGYGRVGGICRRIFFNPRWCRLFTACFAVRYLRRFLALIVVRFNVFGFLKWNDVGRHIMAYKLSEAAFTFNEKATSLLDLVVSWNFNLLFKNK